MPNTREMKLWRLVNKAFQNSIEKFGDIFAKDVTRDLLANGVTVQEWISVKDRLPTLEDALAEGSVYAYTKAKKVLVLDYQYVCRRSDYILCWMPIAIPQPPNEV